ncbi:hypothetical protein CHU98_g7702 [Xylaria longipes]|nr:hypothetical protein CHU98_g7702 [Xylaria longipes]
MVGLRLLIREEQRYKTNLLFETIFIADNVQFPEWPQLPPTINLAAGANSYPLRFGWMVVDDTMEEILTAVTEYLNFPNEIVESIRDEILWYDPRKQISKSRLYRRMYERRAAPYFYDVIALYVLQFATFETLTRNLLRNHG